MSETTRLVGYTRVSTEDQALEGYGLDAQANAIRAACEQRRWTLAELYRDEGTSGKNLNRAALRAALDTVAAGNASGLVVAKLDRLSRSVADFAALLEWFTDAGAALVALDIGIDTSTPGGRLIGNVFASVAEWERETIAARTRAGLAAARANGKAISRPAVADDSQLERRIGAMRARGMTFQVIADRLNTDGIPTMRGGSEWRPSSVQAAAGYKRRAPRRRPAQLPHPPRRQIRRIAT